MRSGRAQTNACLSRRGSHPGAVLGPVYYVRERWKACACGADGTRYVSPLKSYVFDQVTPELKWLHAKLGAMLPYRQGFRSHSAAAIERARLGVGRAGSEAGKFVEPGTVSLDELALVGREEAPPSGFAQVPPCCPDGARFVLVDRGLMVGIPVTSKAERIAGRVVPHPADSKGRRGRGPPGCVDAR